MKTNKRIAAMLTSGVLALTPCVAAVGMTSFAAADSSVTITPAVAGEHDYNVYQILKGNVSGTAPNYTLSNIEWGSNVNVATLITALKGNSKFTKTVDGVTENLFAALPSTNEASAEAFAAVIKSNDFTQDMANELAKVAFNNKNGTGKNDKDADETGKYVIDQLDGGYYLIVDEADISNSNPRTLNLLKVAGSTTVNTKESLPTLTKKVWNATKVNEDNTKGAWDDANTASIGDTVRYQLSAPVPKMEGFTKYFFIMNDTLDDHLSFVADATGTNHTPITVKVSGETDPLAEGTDYYVEQNGQSLKIVFKDFYNKFNTTARQNGNKEITVEFGAVLKPDFDHLNCGTSNGGHENTAHLTYSNNPNVEPEGTPAIPESGTPGEPDYVPPVPAKPDEPNPNRENDPNTPIDESNLENIVGTTPDSVVYTYVTDFVINKFYMDGADKKALDGAKFQLSGTSLKTVSSKGNAYTESTTGTFYKLKDGTFTKTAPAADGSTDDNYASTTTMYAETALNNTDVTPYYVEAYGVSAKNSAGNAVVTFKGLGEGEYTIYEIEAPEGYNKLSAPLTLTITATPDEKGAHWKYSIDSKTPTESNVTEVENKPGSTLPSTGGIGTKLFYFFGSLLFGGSAVLLVTRKRMSAKED